MLLNVFVWIRFSAVFESGVVDALMMNTMHMQDAALQSRLSDAVNMRVSEMAWGRG